MFSARQILVVPSWFVIYLSLFHLCFISFSFHHLTNQSEASKLTNFTQTPPRIYTSVSSMGYWIYQSPATKTTVNSFYMISCWRQIYILGYGGQLWVTTDAGETYSYHQYDVDIYDMFPHPTLPGIFSSWDCFNPRYCDASKLCLVLPRSILW